MKLWIARDEGSNYCKLFINKPYKVYDKFIKRIVWLTQDLLGTYMCLPDDNFPEVTFENSPMEVELKLVEK